MECKHDWKLLGDLENEQCSKCSKIQNKIQAEYKELESQLTDLQATVKEQKQELANIKSGLNGNHWINPSYHDEVCKVSLKRLDTIEELREWMKGRLNTFGPEHFGEMAELLKKTEENT